MKNNVSFLAKSMLFGFLALGFLACTKSNNKETKDSKGIPVIDLEAAVENPEEPLKMSDFVEEIEYIRPEYPASLVSTVYETLMNDKHLLLHTGNRLLCYTRDGKFLRQIGHQGQGPQEYVGIRAAAVYKDFAAINSNFIRKGLWFDIKGNYLKSTPIPNEVFKIDILDTNRVAIHQHHGTPINNPKLFIAGILDSKGDTIQLKKTTPYYPKGIAKSPSRWYYKDTIRVFTCLNDTVYSITKNAIQPRFVINLGKYKVSKEAFANSRLLQKQRKNFIKHLSCCETSKYLLTTFPYQEKVWFVVYNKQNKQLHSWANKPDSINKYGFLRGGEWSNDIDGGLGFSGFINVGKKGHIAFTIEPYDFKEKFDPNKKAKYPAKQEKLQKLVNSLDDDENPIVVLYKLKE